MLKLGGVVTATLLLASAAVVAARPDGRLRFEWRAGKLYQRSAIDPQLEPTSDVPGHRAACIKL